MAQRKKAPVEVKEATEVVVEAPKECQECIKHAALMKRLANRMGVSVRDLTQYGA